MFPEYHSQATIDHILTQMLPEIRKDLFGPNENRKFYT